jgi:hypothetical protein
VEPGWRRNPGDKDLLAERGDLDRLRARADAGDSAAARRLAGLLAEREDLDGLRDQVDAGNMYAAWQLIELLEKQGQGQKRIACVGSA